MSSSITKAAWQAAQPKVYVPTEEEKTGAVPGAHEGESLKVLKATAGKAASQKMGGFSKAKWSGDDQLFWTGGKEGDKLDLELTVADPGEYAIEIVFTKARDYAIVQLHLDEAPLGKPIDLYNNPDVITTGVIKFDKRTLKAGKHTLTIEITGANEKAVKAYMVGLDYVRLVK